MSFPNEFVRQFHELTLILLTEPERDELHRSLRAYQRTHDLAKLAKASSHLLKTAERAKLLHYIRAPMTMPERLQFDRLLGLHGANSTQGSLKSLRVDPNAAISRAPGSSRGSERFITIQGTKGGSMGFSIRGGSEFGLGIYVSAVRIRSPAGEADLKVGDQILSANGVDFGCVANSGACKVLSSSALLRLVISRTGKVPEWKVAKERVLWYDTTLRKVVRAAPVGELQSPDRSYDIIEQKLIINIRNATDFVGLNIRGGCEYGVGIYVSRTDLGGLAAKAGISPGDQIIRVNDTSFLSIEHAEAVDVLRSSVHLIITIRSVGKYPVFKELFAEYTWSTIDNKKYANINEATKPGFSTFKGEGPSEHRTQRARARESSIDLHPQYIQGQVNSSYQNNEVVDLDDGLEVQTELCYPSDNDIMFRRNYEDSWQQIDAIKDNNIPSEEQTQSWTVDNKNSLEHFNQDSDMSDTGLDYTTFLEKNLAQKERKASGNNNKKFSHNNSFSSGATDTVPVIETVIEEGVTSFKTQKQNFNNYVPNSPGLNRNVPISPVSSRSSSDNHVVIIDGRKHSSGSKKSLKSSRAPDIPSPTSSSQSSVVNGDADVDHVASQIKQLEARKSHLGTWEITRVAGSSSSSVSVPSSPELEYDAKPDTKVGTWSSLKKKIKGSFRTRGPKKRASLPTEAEFVGGGSSTPPPSSVQQRGVFQRSFGSQILNSTGLDRYNLMAVLEDHARKTLSEDECKAVMRHVHNYQENKQLDRLVDMLQAILDKPEKKILFIDVRGVVYPGHLTRFDELMSQQRIKGNTIIVQTPMPHSTPSLVEEQNTNGYSSNGNKHDFAQFSKNDFKDSPEELELIILENEDRENIISSPTKDYEDFDGVETVYISKHKRFLGLTIEGGAEYKMDSVIRVKDVVPGGAASDDKRIQPGIEITEIDGKAMKGVSLKEAESILDVSFRTKSPVNLGIEIRHSYHL